jgi:abnormal spindle-like microcephaly-associated protein
MTKSDVAHVQYPLDDFTYQITNLAVDMRDGIRLTKLLEILSGREDYSQQLRWPTIGTSHRIHNLDVALTAIQTEGINLCADDGTHVTAEDIESGVREKTLFVLWLLISRWKLPRYLENVHLQSEIRILKQTLLLRNEKLPSVTVPTWLM